MTAVLVTIGAIGLCALVILITFLFCSWKEFERDIQQLADSIVAEEKYRREFDL